MPRIQPVPDHVPAAPRGARGLALGLGLTVLLAAALAFLPSLQQGFVLGDDDYNLVRNAGWRGLGGEQLRWMWTSFHVGHWHPLTWMSFGLEYELWGGIHAERMHGFNLVLHAVSALLLFALLRRLLRAGLGPAADARPQAVALAAALGALLWAVHPLRVESVVWATERRDLLSGLFLVATVLAWTRWVAGEGRGWWLAALGLYALSLLSKAWGMTLPVVLLLLDVYPLRRLEAAGGGLRGVARLALEKWPFVPLAAATAALAAAAQSSGHATLTMAEHGLLQRCAQAAYGLLFYPWKTLVPSGLSTLYLLDADLDPLRPVYLLSAAGVALLAFGAWRLRERMPALPVALACYAVLVSPVLGFLQSGGQEVADRYSYLAAIPFSALVAAGLVGRVQDERRRRAWTAGALAVLALLAGLSWRQTRVWRDSLTLWGRAVELEPDNYVAHLNVAAALREEGRLAEARASALRSIEARPDARNVYARFFLGLLWLDEGDFEQALAAWQEALRVDPSDVTTLTMASRELLQRGRGEEASQLLQEAYAAAPDDLEVAALVGDFLETAGQAAQAERVWRRGLLRDPGWVEGHLGLGRLALGRIDLVGAERELRAALEGEPDRVETLLLLGRVLRARGLVGEAEAAWQRVLALVPGHAEAESLLRQSRAASGQGR